ncbi:hypothetical protein HY484_03690, partial [Candidatus Woesearchaeota archaeon]|nr:hypothetical protein [Candidatus Woesearchaeota archaeon]
LLTLFYLLILAASAQTLIHKTTFLRAITKNSLHKIVPRFIISIIILIVLITITGYLLTKVQPKIAITTNAVLAIIWTTWMANETLKCTKPDK